MKEFETQTSINATTVMLSATVMLLFIAGFLVTFFV
jgi:hypothetical protein